MQVVKRAVGTQTEVAGAEGVVLRLPVEAAVGAEADFVTVKRGVGIDAEARHLPGAAVGLQQTVGLPGNGFEQVAADVAAAVDTAVAVVAAADADVEVVQGIAAVGQVHIDAAAFQQDAVKVDGGGLFPQILQAPAAFGVAEKLCFGIAQQPFFDFGAAFPQAAPSQADAHFFYHHGSGGAVGFGDDDVIEGGSGAGQPVAADIVVEAHAAACAFHSRISQRVHAPDAEKLVQAEV